MSDVKLNVKKFKELIEKGTLAHSIECIHLNEQIYGMRYVTDLNRLQYCSRVGEGHRHLRIKAALSE